jgi:fermentation-respiration switch protein FrsA (DUF1100 family)
VNRHPTSSDLKLLKKVDGAKGGSHEKGRRVQDAGWVTLAAWHYLPDQHSGKVPTIVMAHGFSAVKEMYLDRFAEVFAETGLGALVFETGILA